MQDKLVFSFLMCVNLQRAEKNVDDAEWLFLLTGGVSLSSGPSSNPAPEWLPESSWQQIQWLNSLDKLKVGLGLNINFIFYVSQKFFCFQFLL